MARKYPLEPLQRLRKERVDESAQKLADAQRTVDTCRAELARRARHNALFDADCARTEEAERGRLERGEVRAADLFQAAAFRVGADLEKTRRAGQLDKARSEAEKARADADHKQEGVARARADADVVDKNRQAWEAEREAQREKAEEQGAEEAFSGRGRAARRGR